MEGLESQGEVDGDGGGAVPAFGVDDGEYFAAGGLAAGLAACGGQADERFEEVGGAGGALDVLADACAHGAHDELGLCHGADGKDGSVGEFLMQDFDGADGGRQGIGGNIHQNDVGGETLSLTDDRVVGGQRKGRVAAHGASYAGAIHKHLEHSALVIVRGKYGY